jgi:hypothetical protein
MGKNTITSSKRGIIKIASKVIVYSYYFFTLLVISWLCSIFWLNNFQIS